MLNRYIVLKDKGLKGLKDRTVRGGENSEFSGKQKFSIPESIAEIPQRSARPAGGRLQAPAIRIVLPLPPRVLWPNARPHWAARARAVKAYRSRARVETLLAMHRARLDRPRWPAAVEQTSFYFHDRRNRDRDNCLAAMKSAFDGIADAGLVANDHGLTHLPVRVDVDPARPRVEVVVTTEPESIGQFAQCSAREERNLRTCGQVLCPE